MIPFNFGKSCPCLASGFNGAKCFGFRFLVFLEPVASEADIVDVGVNTVRTCDTGYLRLRPDFKQMFDIGVVAKRFV